MLPKSRDSSTEDLSKQNDQTPGISDILAVEQRWTRVCVEVGGASQAWIAHVNKDKLIQWTAHWPAVPILHPFPAHLLERAIRFGEPVTFQDHEELISGGIFPLLTRGRVTGVVGLLSTQMDFFSPRATSWIRALIRILSENFFEGQSQGPGQRLIEHSIHQLLHASMDAKDPLPAVLELIANAVQADALTVLSYDARTQRLDLFAAHGLDGRTMAKLRLYFETGLAGKAIRERQPVWMGDLQDSDAESYPLSPLGQEGLRSYLALPLIGHNDFLGILEIAWQTRWNIDASHLDFLERMAEHMALTMERTALVRDLRHRNQELASTYTAIIEGLSRALELRDLETEGHTRRVSVLMMRFVEHMHIPSDQWDAIRQGALLHDIGKLGIPDAILLKPGSLTNHERQVMQQHAVYGYNVLAPIINLRQTLDITLYHHERWDGSGYPYSLRGEQIPLVARLFAVVDVFDALTSDRPYRPSWSHLQAVEYLKEQAGQQFDPHIVELFLEILRQRD